MSERERLPNRRLTDTFRFEHAGHRYIASVGRFADGRPAELFLNTDMQAGSTSDTTIADAAVCVSLALQYGCPLGVIQSAIRRGPDGEPSGPLGTAIYTMEDER
jgi:hypothetical protein